MFCFQCQETVNNTGCTKVGVCGKKSSTSNLQDLLIWNLKGLGKLAVDARTRGVEVSKEITEFFSTALFITITNANFNDEFIFVEIEKAMDYKEELLEGASADLPEAATWLERDFDLNMKKAEEVGILAEENEDIRSLKELIIYGLKGLAAYNSHANALKAHDQEIDVFIQETLSSLLDDLSLDELVALTLKTGEEGYKTMALLSEANNGTYGNTEISEVSLEPRDNPAILISGHDLRDMKMLLDQCAEAGVDVYTHSEMLPANYYPDFKSYDNLVGNYGGAWHAQRKDFESFNGPILMTTNCIIPPSDSYKDRLYTTGSASFPGCPHIEGSSEHKDFSEIIEHAKRCAAPEKIESGTIIGGFGHEQVFQLADKIVGAVESGDIRKFVVMAGCDGRQRDRDYYTEFAEKLPGDTVILTAGCAKYRYNKLGLGDIGGIPRVIDAGQCNDSYSLVRIALKLAEVFGVEDVNDLPIFYNIAWYEQKAVIVLLALLSLGVKNITLGPTLPAFISPNVLDVLVENFQIRPNTTVEEDLKLA